MKIRMRVLCNDVNYRKPERAHWFDAGLDCYSAIVKSLKPGETAKIPLGFSLQIPHGNVVLLTPRSSLNAKGIIVRLGTIDSDYSGEIAAVAKNESDRDFSIDFSTKLCQLVMLPIHSIEAIADEDFDAEYDNRSDKGFGSTDRKQ